MASSFFQKAKERATEAANQAQAFVAQQQAAHSANQQHQHQQQQQQTQNSGGNYSHSHSQSQDSTTSTIPNQSTGTASGAGGLSSYTSVVPHLFRNQIANYDPRFESTRSFHILSTSLKNVSIDHLALCKQNKTAAANTFRFGQDHIPGKREDGVGDAALVDVTDRLAYVLSTIGDLHEAHSKRSELARGELKQVRNPEKDLASRRAKRVAIKKELSGMVPERAKANSNAKATELEAQLRKLEVEDKEDEERVASLKRTAVRDGYEGLFDSVIELGEKLALVARYGKLLTHVVPVGETPSFPSLPQHLAPGEASWAGAAKVAEIRRSIEPALKNYQPVVKVPDVFDTLNPNARSDSNNTLGTHQQHQQGGGGIAGGISLQDTQVIGHSSDVGNQGTQSSAASIISGSDSYAVSHAEELADDPSGSGGQSLSPLPQGGSLPPNLNMSPTFGNQSAIGGTSPSSANAPNLPNREGSVKHRLPPFPASSSPNSYNPDVKVASPLPSDAPQPPTPNPSDLNLPLSNFGSNQNLPPTQSVQNLASSQNESQSSNHTAPDDPTFAETGRPIHGPGGPKSGSLGAPRRPSNVSSNNEVPSASTLTGGAAAHSQYQSKAQEAEAERERARLNNQTNSATAPGVGAGLTSSASARIRRDGTIVRRGEADFQAAEEEGLPVYQAVENPTGGADAAVEGNQQELSEAARTALENERNGGKGRPL